MTEQEWLECSDPTLMLEFLQGPPTRLTRMILDREVSVVDYHQRQMSERKARLFACACCRRFWHLLDEKHCRRLIEFGRTAHSIIGREMEEPAPDCCHKALELTEKSADEPVSPDELNSLSQSAYSLSFPAQDYCACYGEEIGPFDNMLVAAGEAANAIHKASMYYDAPVDFLGKKAGAFDCLEAVIWQTGQAAAFVRTTLYGENDAGGDPKERVAQCALLREIIGNPFRPVDFNPPWRTPNVTAVAQTIYDERRFADMPILADALEEAGCTSQEMLDHCRNPGEHVRGCWVVDLALAKE